MFAVALVAGIFLWALIKKVDIFGAFCEGAEENFKTAIGLFPTLCGVMLAVGLLRESGILGAIVGAIAPVCEWVGIPAEVMPLAILRPVSGSGALAILDQIYMDYHPDSFIGRVASVMIGSTETTFYVLAVYFGATKVKKTGGALWASLAGDLVAVAVSVAAVRLMWG